MDLWKAKVSTYTKTQRGKKTLQSEIRLNKGHPFTKDDIVIVGKEEDINQLKEAVRLSEIEKNEILKKLVVSSEVINQYKEVMKTQETLLAIYTNRGLFGRLMNREPQELEELKEDKGKLKMLEDSTPLVIELSNPAGELEEKGE
jgi:hypothetical protein